MKISFKNLSIKNKFNIIILSTCSAVLLFTFLIVFVSQWFLYKRNAMEELATLTKIVGDNSAAALMFNDDEVLKKTLQSLGLKSSVHRAGFYGNEGTLIVQLSFHQDNDFEKSPLPQKISQTSEKITWTSDRKLHILTPIILDAEKIGFLYIRAGMEDLYRLLFEWAQFLGAAALAGIVFAVIMAGRLQRIFTTPVLALTKAVHQISHEKDYRLRVDQERVDELGVLAAGFNTMLDNIQKRDELLEDQVRDRTVKLQATMERAVELAEKAQSASRSKSMFLANMSHEIRTPMNGVLGMAELLEETPLTRDQKKMIGTIKESGDSLLMIINDILDFTKIEAGKLTIEFTPCNLKELVQAVCRIVSPQAQAKSLNFIENTGDIYHPHVHADPLRIRQILLNLLSNAVKFTDQGEVRVQLDPVWENEKNIRIRFCVSDSGVGMDRDTLDNLFRPFTQADESTTREYGGTGLGLAICKQLVELMDGVIQCESHPGQGSEFSFELDFKKADPAQLSVFDFPNRDASRNSVLEEGAGIAPLVLLAEDNTINQEVSVGILKHLGCMVDLVDNGEKAMAAVASNTYDAVFMDCQMPIMDGYEATRRIRAMDVEDPQGRPLPVIALTAHALDGDREKCIEAGMDDHLSKPFRKKQMAAVLDRWLPDRQIPDLTGAQVREPAPKDGVLKTDGDGDEVIRTSSLEAIRTLQPPVGEDILTKIIQIFVREAPERMEKISLALDTGDVSAVQSHAHYMKSSSGNLGALHLSSLYRRLEETARNQNTLEGISGILKEIDSAQAQAINHLKPHMVNKNEK